MTLSPARNPWIRCFKSLPDCDTQLVCFPHAGGSASYYLSLAQRLAPGTEVLPVQYPGRQERYKEPFCTSIHELADGIFAALSLRLTKPYAFFGHSMGSILAFEVARRFERSAGTGPSRIFASARRAPSTRDNRNVHLRDDAGLVAEMRRLGGTDPGVLDDEDLVNMILPVVRADYRVIEAYSCPSGTSVRCPVTVLVGDRDPVVTTEQAAGWREHTTGGFDVVAYPGGHFYLAENVDKVAEDIAAALGGSDDSGSPVWNS
ncbi:thioesterase II family protein [Saccharopolyspora shandongensis]|uniref:thioesterase II family protein n=1 Tax=Saccharopolyspora shandongensis TaxID=418495 RepID=UPI0033BFC48C